MRKNNLFFYAAFLFAAMIFVSGCKDNKDNPVTPTNEGAKSYNIQFIDATSYGDVWTYFNLEEGKVVEVKEDEHFNNKSWDIAFNRYNVRTNGGASGAGNGGAYDMGQVEMNSVAKVPDDINLVVDSTWSIVGDISSMPPSYISSTANPLLSKAISSAGMPPSYVSDEHVYIVKTASGKWAKLIFTSYYNDELPAKSGYISFDYVIQTNGGKEF
ncbi:MAG: HmuY family protein [Bacteroidetes bacterium]|nr:HmuY family protein [Bacteroidota bacterium]